MGCNNDVSRTQRSTYPGNVEWYDDIVIVLGENHHLRIVTT